MFPEFFSFLVSWYLSEVPIARATDACIRTPSMYVLVERLECTRYSNTPFLFNPSKNTTRDRKNRQKTDYQVRRQDRQTMYDVHIHTAVVLQKPPVHLYLVYEQTSLLLLIIIAAEVIQKYSGRHSNFPKYSSSR